MPTSPIATPAEITNTALEYIELGWFPIEISSPSGTGKSSGKSPIRDGWQKMTEPPDPRWYGAGNNVGLRMGRQPSGEYLVAIDIDGDPNDVFKLASDWPDTLISQSRAGRYVMLYVWPEEVEKPTNAVKLKIEGDKTCLDLRSEGGQIVVYPSTHPTGSQYQWITDIPPAALPIETAQAIVSALKGFSNRSGARSPSGLKNQKPSVCPLSQGPDEDATRPASTAESDSFPLSSARWHAICLKVAKSASPLALYFEQLSQQRLEITNGERDQTLYRICWELAGHCPNATPDSIQAHFETALSYLQQNTGAFAKWPDMAEKFARAVAKRAEIASQGLQLALGPTGTPRPNLTNVLRVFEKDPALIGRLAYNSFAARVEVLEPTPWHREGVTYPRQWDDRDAGELVNYLFEAHRLEIASALAHEGAVLTSWRLQYHPVRDYLSNAVAKWDGVSRINTWLTDYLGAEDSEYTRRIGAWWLMQGIARVATPGCQADYCLIFEGTQGIGKSQTLRALASPAWFGDDLEDIGSRETSQRLAGKWIIELSELAVARKADVNKLKAFISRACDRYRVPYGRCAEDFPRQCIFAGSTNDFEYLNDPTGGRRFWPVRVSDSAVDVEKLKTIRDQLWAEAAVRVAAGERYWPTGDEETAMFAEQVAKRRQVDSWEERILEWLENPVGYVEGKTLTTAWLLDTIFGLEQAKRADDSRLSNALVSIGWTRVFGTGRTRIWQPDRPIVPISGVRPNNIIPMAKRGVA